MFSALDFVLIIGVNAFCYISGFVSLCDEVEAKGVFKASYGKISR